MFRWALRKGIDKFEQEWNYDTSYIRDMIDASPRAAWLVSRVTHLLAAAAFVAATESGDLNALTQLLASDVRVVTDGGGRVAAALDVVDGADRAARFLVGVTRKRPGAWWREDFTLRFATIHGLPGVIVDGPEGPVQTAAFEIEGDVIRALYVVRNSDKLRHLAAAPPPHARGPG